LGTPENSAAELIDISVPHAIVVGSIAAEETLGAAVKARAAAMDEVGIGARRQRLEIVSAAQDGLYRAVVWGVVREGALAGGFEPCLAIGVGEAERALSSAQSLDDPIGQQPLNEGGALGADGGGLLKAPSPVATEELARIRWQMIEHGAPLAAAPTAHMHRH